MEHSREMSPYHSSSLREPPRIKRDRHLSYLLKDLSFHCSSDFFQSFRKDAPFVEGALEDMHKNAEMYLFHVHLHPQSQKESQEKAFNLLMEATKRGSGWACYLLGCLWESGQGIVTPNFEKAKKLIAIAGYQLGNPCARLHLTFPLRFSSSLFSKSRQASPAYKEALLEDYKVIKALALKTRKSQYLYVLGRIFMDGCMDPNLPLGLKWLEKAAYLGNVYAQRTLGDFCFSRRLPKDIPLCKKFYSLAASRKDLPSQKTLHWLTKGIGKKALRKKKNIY
jgi:TPR repeat protein